MQIIHYSQECDTMIKPFEQMYTAKHNEELRKQILEHLEMPDDSKIVGNCSTLFFDSYHKVVVEIPIQDETGVFNALLTPLVASYETLRGHLNNDLDSSKRIKHLV